MAYCSTCDKWFASQRAAEQHMDAKDHWGEQADDNAYFSDQGSNSYASEEGEEGEDEFECETCHLTFSSEEDADDHMYEEDHWGCECDTCDGEFHSEHGLAQHMIACNHSQSPMATDMVRLDCEDSIFGDIEEMFQENWNFDLLQPSVQTIYFNRRYAYLFEEMPFGWDLQFHGTTRACRIGEGGYYLDLCCDNHLVDDECSLCFILRDGFKLPFNFIGSFGRGIYSTRVSSKSDFYAQNRGAASSGLQGIILCLVFIGNYEKLYDREPSRSAPRRGCHSIMAATIDEGGTFPDHESVVYDRASILPIGLIMYTRRRV